VLTNQDRASLLNQAQALLNAKPFSKQNEAQFHSVMRLVDAIDADKRHAQSHAKLKELENEQSEARQLRVQEEFRHFVHRPAEKRTYAALETGVIPGGATVPQGQWLKQYQERLVSASGWLRAGATLRNVTNGLPFITFFSDDEANEAQIIGENATLPQANTVFAAPKPDVKNFATATTVTNQLLQDVQFDLDSFLQGLFANRVARKFNAFATSDATYGLLAQLTVGATTSGASPSYDELVDMQDQIDPAYLESDSQPVYMMSQSLRNVLLKTRDTAGFPLFPEIKSGQLLGLPLVINVDMTANAGDVAVVCGSVKRAVLVQSENTLIRSSEAQAEFYRTLYGYVARMGVKLIDGDAVTALKLHA
jgi:HK97 family phage major capsid protein